MFLFVGLYEWGAKAVGQGNHKVWAIYLGQAGDLGSRDSNDQTLRSRFYKYSNANDLPFLGPFRCVSLISFLCPLLLSLLFLSVVGTSLCSQINAVNTINPFSETCVLKACIFRELQRKGFSLYYRCVMFFAVLLALIGQFA